MRSIDRLFPLWAALSFAAPAVVGFVVTGIVGGRRGGFPVGKPGPDLHAHHVTWSITRSVISRGPAVQTTDFSTNNWVLSVISFGESWHNNHHAFPTSAIHGLRPSQIDATAGLIRVLKAAGLTWDVKTVTPKQLAAKSAS